MAINTAGIRRRKDDGNEQGVTTMMEVATAIRTWADEQFGAGDSSTQIDHCLLGALEETGELSHAVLKWQQGIRGTPEQHLAGIKDAIADICIYLADYVTRVATPYAYSDMYYGALKIPEVADRLRIKASVVDPETQKNLRTACFELAHNIGVVRMNALCTRVKGYDSPEAITHIFYTCDCITRGLFCEPLWQVVERVWGGIVAKRDWKKNATTGTAVEAPPAEATPAPAPVPSANEKVISKMIADVKYDDAPIVYEHNDGWKVSLSVDLDTDELVIRSTPPPEPVSEDGQKQRIGIDSEMRLPFDALYPAQLITVSPPDVLALGKGEVTLLLHVEAQTGKPGRVAHKVTAEEINRVLVQAFLPLAATGPEEEWAKGWVPLSELRPVEESTSLSKEQLLAQQCIRAECAALADFLCMKNLSYGNAAFAPRRVFSAASALEQILVRQDDKLNRLLQGQKFEGDNDKDDLLGYLLLERAVRRFQEPQLNLE